MMRVALGIEYYGTQYCGWQHQDHCVSVQSVVERALSFVANESIRVSCAGRTDAGVHAHGQVVHFDTSAQRSEHNWVFGANANLPDDVTILWAKQVDEQFHARYSAYRRAYRYIIQNREVRPGLYDARVSWDYRLLDVQLMQQAAQHLLGEHDFSSYRALACQAKSPVRTLHRLEIQRQGEMITFDIEANGFLHHMVRNIAGVLMTIGAGEQSVDWSKQILEACDRTRGGMTAPADGLYFLGARYPSPYDIDTIRDTLSRTGILV